MKKIILYSATLLIGILIFTLSVAFNVEGVSGFLLIMLSIYLFVGSIIKLCQLSDKFKTAVGNTIDLLFWLP